ncbi:MAG TPA: glycyl-radical enzyme activating protein [Polyangia bacterium]|jgi:pyruvate formate lyase activating enzyme
MTGGVLFDVQHYAVHDGPGIRTLVFLKGCPLRCVWCCNPESHSAAPQLRHRATLCRGCRRCAGACPAGAITRAGERVRLDRARCPADCGAPCVDACVESALGVVGERAAAASVIARVAADLPFYRNSGGGLTVSGGEPFAQPAYLRELLRDARGRGIHTAVETCGQAAPDDVLAAEPLVDLFLFDLKLVDARRHRELTGAGNERILANLRLLAARAPARVVVRVPLVPGLTDGAADLAAAADLVAALGLREVHLQPYHPLGRDKYAALGMTCAFATAAASDPAAAARIFAARGLTCGLT